MKRRALWPLQAVRDDNGTAHFHPAKFLEMVAEGLHDKWVGTHQERERLLEALNIGATINVTDIDCVGAVHACKHKTRADRIGICAHALSIAILVDAQWWSVFFHTLANRNDWMQQLEIIGPVEGKLAGVVQKRNARALLPQPVFLQVLHNIEWDRCGR